MHNCFEKLIKILKRKYEIWTANSIEITLICSLPDVMENPGVQKIIYVKVYSMCHDLCSRETS